MLRSVQSLFGYRLQATDGAIGHVKDFYVDDQRWTIRYLVVDTGHWLPGRRVLLSPVAVGHPSWETRTLPVSLTREQVKHSPDIGSELPVSRQQELELHTYYSWPVYWGGFDMTAPAGVGLPPNLVEETKGKEGRGDPHLRSAREVVDYAIQASDGRIGHVDDFIVEEEAWVLRYIVVDTRDWLPGRRVLLPTQWIRQVEWAQASVHVDVTCEQVKNAPEFNPRELVNREYEVRLYDYYGRPAYWP